MRVSAIVPAYNRAGLLEETLRSLMAQRMPPHELIVELAAHLTELHQRLVSRRMP
ncbi:MAG TPA: glycosyltransferase family A protein [Rhizomicrobium sp.]|jgi:GT2 family glycosyltransferase|nr:glycosyltransferase family A protein [Rhizomicrobium sp.]